MSLLWKPIRLLLFLTEAEVAHELGRHFIQWTGGLFGGASRVLGGNPNHPALKREVFGLEFRNPLGLAAGFDKNAEMVSSLAHFGFGFVEIGTVTPRPQGGNLKPRLFRDPSQKSLFNRMGFNNLGASLIAGHLEKVRKSQLPAGFRIGANIGKNLDTSLEDASKDYVACIKELRGLVDYFVLNVSSPNTPGLRELQDPERLKRVVEPVCDEIAKGAPCPLLLKLAPELSEAQLQNLAHSARDWQIQGWVLTNTLVGDRAATGSNGQKLTGGYSGGALSEHSRRALRQFREMTSLPIVSVGGILTVDEALERLDLGAELLEIYTGWIYEGPHFPLRICKELVHRAEKNQNK